MSTLDTAEPQRSSRTAAEWLWPLLPIGLSVFCLSALFYFHVNHGAVSATSALQRMIAGIYRTFGLAPAVMFFFLVGTWSTIWFVTGKLDRPLARIGRLVAMAVMLGVFLNLGEGGVTAAVHKGELGAWLAATLVASVGYFPSLVLVWAITFASLLLATDFFFSDSFERLRHRPTAAVETGVESAVTDHLRGLHSALQPAVAGSESPRPAVLEEPESSTAWEAAPPAERSDQHVREEREEREENVDEPGWRTAAVAPQWTEPVASEAADLRGDDLAFADDAPAIVAVDAAEPVVAIPRPDSAPRGHAPTPPAADELPFESGTASAAVHGETPVRQQNLFDAGAVDEELIHEAVELITGSRRVTATLLQRRLRIDYAQALDLLAQLAARGVVELEADASQGRVVV